MFFSCPGFLVCADGNLLGRGGGRGGGSGGKGERGRRSAEQNVSHEDKHAIESRTDWDRRA